MPLSPSNAPSIAIIGGGITGLAAAYRLHQQRPDVQLTLFEASDQLGGVLQTVDRDGYLIERSADNFLTKLPWASELCQQLGIGDELLPTDKSRRRALVVNRGRVVRTPEGFVVMSPKAMWPMLRSDILSLRGKLRLCCEPFIKRKKTDDDESVASFATRRFGKEVFERLVQPLLAGIYTADPEKLSLAATMPQFVEQEQQYGSLWRAARAEARKQPNDSAGSESGARYGLFVAPRNGMKQMVAAVAAKLPAEAIRLNSPIGHLREDDQQGWLVADDEGAVLGNFDSVILTTPAHHAAKLVGSIDNHLASDLAGIEYAGASIVCLGYRQEQVKQSLEGFGFVVPAIEGRQIIAASFSSLKFPGRSPDGKLLVRVFLGGALQPELTGLPDDELITIAKRELSELVGISGEPGLTEIARWPKAMPQYHVGHLARVERIETASAKHRGLEIAGAAYRGVGIPQCVHSGEQAADRVLQLFESSNCA